MLKRLLALSVLLTAAVTSHAWTIRGTVTSYTGDSLSGVTLTLRYAALPSGAPVTATRTTSATGAYSFVITGAVGVEYAYRLIASNTGFDPDTFFSSSRDPISGTEIDIRDFTLYPTGMTPGSVTGRVTDSLTTANIAGAKVYLQERRLVNIGGMFAWLWVTLDSATSASTGLYTISNVLPATGLRIRTVSTGYVTKTTTGVNVVTSQVTTVNVALNPLVVPVGTVSGIITDSISTEALIGATVIIARPGVVGFEPETTTTNIMGTYTFTNIPVSTGYAVTALFADFYTKTSALFAVTVGATSTQNLALKPINATISGTVRSTVGATLLNGAKVILQVNNGGFAALDSLVTDATGTYNFGPLMADTYRVAVSMTGFYDTISTNIILPDAQNLTRNMVLRPVGRGTLHVRVNQDTIGSPVIPGANVYAVLTSGPIAQDTLKAVTDELGWVHIANAIEGSYNVSAYAAGFNAVSIGRALTNNEQDTGYILVTRYTGNTKTLGGWVRTSSGIVVGATCSLKVGLYTFVTTSDNFGEYLIRFPNTFTSGRLGVTATSCLPWGDSTVTLSASATTKNVTLESSTGRINLVSSPVVPSAISAGRGALIVTAETRGVFSLYGIDGRLLSRRAVSAGRHSIETAKFSGPVVAELVCGDATVRQTVVLK